MSIYMPNMEMPKNCKECPLTYEDTGNDAYFGTNIERCVLDESELPFDENERHSDCPLREVSPHGRLIDADALISDLTFDVEIDARALDDMDLVGYRRDIIQSDKDCKQNCISLLQESPTIIEANE